jgi:RHH-type proline utilization regulon transcriptional repressor/proline dehydrogenase/delta 1-pyrroline-5-carboxylate dehydrogenase
VGNDLVVHPGIDVIAFTGSREVGLSIYAHAAAAVSRRGPKRVVCEMGGKNAILIDDDADLDEAVRGVIVSAFGYNGQKCSACSRAIVVGNAYPRFLERLVEAAASITIGPPADPENFMGPVISRPAFDQIREYIRVGKSEARCVRDSPSTLPSKGYYLGPTIFADVPPKARIAQEEIFGPVLSVMQAANFDEAIRLANDVDFALTGGVYSRSPDHIDQARREFRVGNLYINRKVTGALVDRQPFGGFKFSGLGSKAGGPDYLLEFVLPQTVTENTLRHGFAPPE